MFRRPVNLKPLSVDQRIGRTRIESRSWNRDREEPSSTKRDVRFRPGVPSSCIATIGSDTIDHSSHVDVKNIKTALAIVHGYDSLKKLKVPRIPEKIPDRLLFSGTPLKLPLTARPFERYQENSFRQTSTQQDKKQLNTAKKAFSTGKCDPNSTKEKDRSQKRQNKKNQQQKGKLKKSITTSDASKSTDMKIPEGKWFTSDASSEGYVNTRSNVIAPNVHPRNPTAGYHWSPIPMPTVFGRVGLGHLTPIAENSEEEQGERDQGEMERPRPGTSPAPQEKLKMPPSRSQPSTQQVHEWLQKSSHKVLSSKECHKPTRAPRLREKSSKMIECASGVIGLSECACSKKKYKRTKGKHTIRNEPTKSKVLMAAIGRQQVFQTKKTGKSQRKNSKTTLPRHTKEMNWMPGNVDDKKTSLKKIIAYDGTKGPELPVPTCKKLTGEYVHSCSSSKFRRNPVLKKPSKQQVQNWVSKSNAVVSTNNVHQCSHFTNKRTSKQKGKMNISRQENKTLTRSWSADAPQKKSIGDMLNSWILQLSN